MNLSNLSTLLRNSDEEVDVVSIRRDRQNSCTTTFTAMVDEVNDPRGFPEEEQLVQLGTAIMTELLDAVGDTGLEDHLGILAESVIGALHSAVGRIEREADRARDDISRLNRDFDGTEIADVELQEAMAKARKADLAVLAAETIRDAMSEAYTSNTGEVWSAWKGSTRGTKTTAAQIDAKQAIRAQKARKHAETDPGAIIVAFRGSPMADTQLDAERIFDALNWAQKEFPGMVLATSGAKGAEQFAIKWAQQKNVRMVLARADFNRFNKAAPFRANDELMELEPSCCIVLPGSLDERKAETTRDFGPALNLGQKAREAAVKCIRITARR